jgi:hypothetical protein
MDWREAPAVHDPLEPQFGHAIMDWLGQADGEAAELIYLNTQICSMLGRRSQSDLAEICRFMERPFRYWTARRSSGMGEIEHPAKSNTAAGVL